MLAKFRQAFRALASMPGIGHTRSDLTYRGLLFWTVGEYLIVYRVSARQVEILALLHCKRDVKAILQRRGE